MPKTSARRANGRYDLAEVARRIEELRIKRDVSVKALCSNLGMDKWDWSRKVRCDRSKFKIEEVGAIADALDAPPGWPFLDEDTGEFLRSTLNMITRVQ